MKISLDLDSIEIGEWSSTIQEVIRDELKAELRSEIRKAIKANNDFKKAVKKMQETAAKDLLGMLG